jgi:cholesterol oxidase
MTVTPMERWYDVVVVGSGFGGSVTACRLAERGLGVLVLERGRRWEPSSYPRALDDPWIFDPRYPERRNGWLDLRVFEDMIVAQGAGVGGGSLIYANVSVVPPPATFEAGWPPEITYAELAPHYATVGDMLGVATVPDNQEPERTRIMREAAAAIGAADRFRKVPLAVTFDPGFTYQRPDPTGLHHSKTWTNRFGKEQGTCVHVGYCDIGCPVKAKNTLDLNYLARAESRGAEIRPLTLVRTVEPVAGGYLVHCDQLHEGRRTPDRVRARRVVLSAGSLNSTEILLRARDQYRTLPHLSPRLGVNWSSNGDFLTPAWHRGRAVEPTIGPTITSAIDFLDGSRDSAAFFIEDGGFPDVLRAYLDRRLARMPLLGRWRGLIQWLRGTTRDWNLAREVMPWFAQGVDAADGRLRLRRPWYAPWRRILWLDWHIAASEPTISAIVRVHQALAHATGGRPEVPITWSLLRNLVTPHPLGGCNMAADGTQGVVDHAGAVFGYRGLYVLDGAIVPEAVGLNPSRTIAALAERAVALMP